MTGDNTHAGSALLPVCAVGGRARAGLDVAIAVQQYHGSWYRQQAMITCPAALPRSPSSTAAVGPLPPTPRYRRYDDRQLQDAYAHVVAALRTTSIPVYGKIFSEDDADQMARHTIDAVRRLTGSADLRTRAICAVTPAITAEVHETVGRLLLGAMTVGIGAMVVNTTIKALR